MLDWTLLQPSRYEASTTPISLPNGDATAMNLKKLANDENFAYDDGLIIQFPSQKPKHLSFYCKSDKALESESCDVKLFRLDHENSQFNGNNLEKINRLEAPIFFRFGYYNYAKINAERGQF